MKYGELNLGQIEALVNKLGGMEGVNRFLSGNAEVVVKNHIIDCDAGPFCPEGWTVEHHNKSGKLTWDASKVTLYLSDGQKNGKVLEGNKLRKELADKPVLNANVLQYLLGHPHLIPEEWKVDENGNTRYIFFWGTIYRNSLGGLCVRGLYWHGGGWHWCVFWLDLDWRGLNPAALCAS
jgi:hypothetical protein